MSLAAEAAWPRVSVVIPCYNAKRFVSATLHSVLSQEGVTLEIIVVDDGSKDGSADLVETEFPAVRVLRLPNSGVAAARNAGIAAAQADWIAFCDADDVWLSGKLAGQFEVMQAVDDCRMSYTAWDVWTSDAPGPEPALLTELAAQADGGRWAGATGWLYPELLLDCVVWTSTVLIHRSVLDEVGVFDPCLRIGEDYDLWLRASRVTRIERVARPLALYRQHPASITRGTPTANYKGRVVQHALRRWGYSGPDGRTVDRGSVHRMLAKSWSDFAAAQLASGQQAAARTSAGEALRQDPFHLPAWKLMLRSVLPRAS